MYYVDPTLQKEAIAKAKVGALYFNDTKKDYLKDEQDFENFVIKNALPETLPFEEALLKIATPKVVDSISVSNNKLLLNNIKNYLQTVKIQHVLT